MNYVLTENKQYIVLGPINWKPNYFESELNDNNIYYTLPAIEPQAHIVINGIYDIFPVNSVDVPNYDSTFEHLAGPFTTFFDDYVTQHYNVLELPLEIAKQNLINIVTNKFY